MLILLATGKCREKPVLDIEAEYYKRLPKNQQPDIRELAASKADNPEVAKAEEAAIQLKAIAALPPQTALVLLDERGTALASVPFAEKLNALTASHKHVAILIGGAAGFTQDVRSKAAFRWSLGPLTFPHQLCRALVAEQLYRAHTLTTGHPYHRA